MTKLRYGRHHSVLDDDFAKSAVKSISLIPGVQRVIAGKRSNGHMPQRIRVSSVLENHIYVKIRGGNGLVTITVICDKTETAQIAASIDSLGELV